MPPDALPIDRAAEHFSPSRVHLDTASIGLPPRAASDALRAMVERWALGEMHVRDFDASLSSARAAFARLVGVEPAHVALASAASTHVGTVAAALPRGARVLCAEGDFTSLLFPFLERQAAGELSVRFCPLEAVPDHIDARTALVAVSAVQSSDGRLCDLDAIEAACRHFGTQSLIDATQAIGWLPLDARRFDHVVVAAYKWLLSPRGASFMSVRPERLRALRPLTPGWFSGADPHGTTYGAPLRLAPDARRLDASPVWLSWLACAEALAFIERVGISAIHAHDLALSAAFLERLGRPPSGSAIVSLPGEHARGALAAAGITASCRGGATRLGFHLYNTLEDVAAAADALRGLR